MTYPVFASGDVLNASDMNAVGLWLVKTQAIVGVGVSVVDVYSCFNADYDNYLISFNGISASTSLSFLFQLLSGVTPTGSGWTSTEFYTAVGATTITGQLSNGTGGHAFCSAGTAASGVASTMDIQSPFLAQQTRFQYNICASDFYRYGFALHSSATSYDGMRITCSFGSTISNGSISVYGRKK
jgi:hypothetical protein